MWGGMPIAHGLERGKKQKSNQRRGGKSGIPSQVGLYLISFSINCNQMVIVDRGVRHFYACLQIVGPLSGVLGLL